MQFSSIVINAFNCAKIRIIIETNTKTMPKVQIVYRFGTITQCRDTNISPFTYIIHVVDGFLYGVVQT